MNRRISIFATTTIKDVLDQLKVLMSNMENPNYQVPARYISSAAKLMELMMTQCGKHSKKAMAKELQIPLSTVDAWIRQVEITLNNKRLKEGRRVVFPYFSKENCHFCKFYPNADENLVWTRGEFGLMHNICNKLLFNPWGDDGYPEETLIQEIFEFGKKLKEVSLTVVFIHQYFPSLCLENLTFDFD